MPRPGGVFSRRSVEGYGARATNDVGNGRFPFPCAVGNGDWSSVAAADAVDSRGDEEPRERFLWLEGAFEPLTGHPNMRLTVEAAFASPPANMLPPPGSPGLGGEAICRAGKQACVERQSALLPVVH